jgi:hypothetical protein
MSLRPCERARASNRLPGRLGKTLIFCEKAGRFQGVINARLTEHWISAFRSKVAAGHWDWRVHNRKTRG